MERNGSAAGIDTARIYSTRAAAAAVGYGKTFIKEQIDAGKLRAYRPGKRTIKIKGSDLKAWFDAHELRPDNIPSCDAPMDGLPSGTQNPPTELSAARAAASVLRGL